MYELLGVWILAASNGPSNNDQIVPGIYPEHGKINAAGPIQFQQKGGMDSQQG
jgi:hypothetical protein